MGGLDAAAGVSTTFSDGLNAKADGLLLDASNSLNAFSIGDEVKYISNTVTALVLDVHRVPLISKTPRA